MTSWDPPFPVDLQRIRPKDEDYWDQYRGAPKAIVTLGDAQRLWGSRYGKVSSLRLVRRCADSIRRRSIRSPPDSPIRNVRADAMTAAQGTTDFGEYFLYFSFFLVVSALLLAYLFFAVGLEQRTVEVGVLASMGFSAAAIRRVFIREGAILAGDRRGDWHRRGDRLQRADPLRAAHLVGRRRRHHRPRAPRRSESG